jgi:phosphoglycerate kinase
MISISDSNLQDRRVLMRVDFNVPLAEENGQYRVTDDTRIRATLPTLQALLDSGASIVLMTHLGRPKEGPEDRFSLQHVVPHLSKLLGLEVAFAADCIGEEAFAASAALKPGQVLLLENLRFYPEEQKGDRGFAEKLSGHGDVYLNDAFGTAHRAHASTAVIAEFFAPEARGFGLLMAAEIENADKVLADPQRPLVAILGGAKVSGKIMIIERLLDVADTIIIGGGMSYTFAVAAGGSVGKSLVEEDRIDTARKVVELARQKGVQLLLPEDSVTADAFDNEAQVQVSPSGAIAEGWMGLDIGPAAREAYAAAIASAKTILWNGPMGVFEMDNFQAGTKAVATAVAKATENGAFSLVGGGDSVAAVNRFGYANKVSYVSTGGGAMLEYFEGKALPGIAAVRG